VWRDGGVWEGNNEVWYSVTASQDAVMMHERHGSIAVPICTTIKAEGSHVTVERDALLRAARRLLEAFKVNRVADKFTPEQAVALFDLCGVVVSISNR
jgi:hypothetical protein